MSSTSKLYLFLFVFVLLYGNMSCMNSNGQEQELESALEFALDNRSELEKVLAHYADDSLKLKAAKYLIVNMPGHYSYADSDMSYRYALVVDSVVNHMKDETDYNVIRDSIDNCAMKIGMDTLRKEFDSRLVSSDFLIKNIDEAFDDWQNGAWARHIGFDDFCEYILPYKTEELQPLDNWRSRVKRFLTEKLADLDCCDQLRNSPLAAARILNKNLADSLHPITGLSVKHVYLPLECRAHIPFGQCDDYVKMATSVFRSHGIPAYEEFTPQWAGRSLGHAWNVLLESDGRKVSFAGITERIDGLHKPEERMAKVYRRTYAMNKDLQRMNLTEPYVPEVFRDIFIKDVTSEEISCCNVSIDVKNNREGYAYLLTFDNRKWVPVAYGKMDKGKALFRNMGLNIVYLLACYNTDGEMETVGNPFILHYNGSVEAIVPDTCRRMTLRLSRKYPVMEYAYEYIPRLTGGEFQASDTPDFSTYQIVHKIKKGCAEGVEFRIPNTIKPHRYWRYISSRYASFCSIAEISFYSGKDTLRAKGKVIGTEGSWGNDSTHTREKVFDDDILTSFDAPRGENCWVGVDFGKPVRLDHIIYYGRGDGNSVELGDTYGLYYWNGERWECIGKKKASHPYVVFHGVPTGGLYLLRDLTKGYDERVFTYRNGKQIWW